MSFLWPGLLALLLIVPALVALYVWAIRRRRPSGIRYSSLALVRDAAPRVSPVRRHLPFALFALALASLGVALSRPIVIAAVPAGHTTVILAIDVSRSMCSTDIPPNRLLAAEAAAESFIDRQPSSTLVGLVAFGGFGEVVQAPTADDDVLVDAVRGLATGRRTAIGSGILTSLDAIAEVDPAVAPSFTESTPGTPPAPVPKGVYAPDIIVLLTDGRSNAGPNPLDAAQQAADRGVRVYTIGFGTENPGDALPSCQPQLVGREPGTIPSDPNQGGGPGAFGGGLGGGFGGAPGGFRRAIDEETLTGIATMTGGEYHTAESADELQSVFQSLPTYLITKNEAIEITAAFAALGVILVGGALLLGQAWRPLP
ncbi:MAG: VWA domain-containing protein [Chloroflexota bacterium]